MSVERFDVVVVGGGHAGAEAAWACANALGPSGRVGLVTLDPAKIGVMSCNPAIGGLAKGQLVREIDALGGLMGLAADATGIQFRVLNTSKGPAVHGPRCQSDKHAYAEAVRALIASRPEIEVVRGAVEGFEIGGGRLTGVRVDVGGASRLIDTHAAVLTTGTFMCGLMHTGQTTTPGGRCGEHATSAVSRALTDLGFELGRLKTGTPPRLDMASIDWDGLPPQLGDGEPVPFSDLTATPVLGGLASSGAFPLRLGRFPALRQVECRQTSTNGAIHELIRANLDRAPMFSGQIESRGPRYCPSIEDKVVRFAERDSHGVFLEPESLRAHDGRHWVYCNGISTSLPIDVQERIVRLMPGCEHAEILQHGYAVEYDTVRPHQIHATGMTKSIPGLFLAGQINGTSGYEEAAAQGLVAGVNAARHARGEPAWVLGRHEAYIGVLMDDLVTKTPTEPYRMFTSRAEHRLLLRSDNAPDRLTPVAERLGLLEHHALGRARRALHERRAVQLGAGRAAIGSTTLDGEALERHIRKQGFSVESLRAALPEHDFAGGVWKTLHAEHRYRPYIERERNEIRRQAEMERKRLPDSLDLDTLTSLRTEAREALVRFRPDTFGQAARLEGVTPADLTLLAVLLHRSPNRGSEPRTTPEPTEQA
ncbi:MAG: tRNA uridine-5-carboxymethylaminomethyl(34) synthesis enzyme MnmG [Phycisphaerales bacterium JB040]